MVLCSLVLHSIFDIYELRESRSSFYMLVVMKSGWFRVGHYLGTEKRIGHKINVLRTEINV